MKDIDYHRKTDNQNSLPNYFVIGNGFVQVHPHKI
jgi:hypothetical protein